MNVIYVTLCCSLKTLKNSVEKTNRILLHSTNWFRATVRASDKMLAHAQRNTAPASQWGVRSLTLPRCIHAEFRGHDVQTCTCRCRLVRSSTTSQARDSILTIIICIANTAIQFALLIQPVTLTSIIFKSTS
jgi:hypothetical protein